MKAQQLLPSGGLFNSAGSSHFALSVKTQHWWLWIRVENKEQRWWAETSSHMHHCWGCRELSFINGTPGDTLLGAATQPQVRGEQSTIFAAESYTISVLIRNKQCLSKMCQNVRNTFQWGEVTSVWRCEYGSDSLCPFACQNEKAMAGSKAAFTTGISNIRNGKQGLLAFEVGCRVGRKSSGVKTHDIC